MKRSAAVSDQGTGPCVKRASGRMAWSVGLVVLIGCLVGTWVAASHFWRGTRVRWDATSAAHSLLALQVYDRAHGQLPPPYETDESGGPVISWRLRLTAYLEEDHFRPNRPWNDPENARFLTYRSRFFCFSRNRASCEASIVAVTGRGTAFDVESPAKLADIDGDTILVVEVQGSGIHWMQPGDLDIGVMSRTIGRGTGMHIAGNRSDGFFVGFADGEVWLLGHDVPFGELEKFFTVQSAKQFDREVVLGPYCRSRIQRFW